MSITTGQSNRNLIILLMTAQINIIQRLAETLQPTELFILSQTQKLRLLTRKNGGAGTTKEEPRKELSLKVIWLLTYHPIN